MNLKRSLQLYKILEPYLPEDLDLEPFDFISIIVRNMAESKTGDYIKALSFITEVPENRLIQMQIPDLFELFANGLIDVQIIYLTEFCRNKGLNNA